MRCSKEGSESETCVWRVRASPDGSLMDLETGKDYPYLFWEAQSKDGRLAQKFKLEETPSFCVPGVQAGEANVSWPKFTISYKVIFNHFFQLLPPVFRR